MKSTKKSKKAIIDLCSDEEVYSSGGTDIWSEKYGYLWDNESIGNAHNYRSKKRKTIIYEEEEAADDLRSLGGGSAVVHAQKAMEDGLNILALAATGT